MPKEKAPVLDPDNALTWPEYSPAVSVSAANRGHNVNFDMETYNKLLDRHGIGPERQDLHVFLEHPADMPIGDRYTGQQISGVYLRELPPESKDMGIHQTKGVFVSYDKVQNRQGVPLAVPTPNNVLIHETKHFQQDVEGKSMSEEKAKKRAETAQRILPVIGPVIEYWLRSDEISARLSSLRNRRKYRDIIKVS